MIPEIKVEFSIFSYFSLSQHPPLSSIYDRKKLNRGKKILKTGRGGEGGVHNRSKVGQKKRTKNYSLCF